VSVSFRMHPLYGLMARYVGIVGADRGKPLSLRVRLL
jgi:hypothetical protein